MGKDSDGTKNIGWCLCYFKSDRSPVDSDQNKGGRVKSSDQGAPSSSSSISQFLLFSFPSIHPPHPYPSIRISLANTSFAHPLCFIFRGSFYWERKQLHQCVQAFDLSVFIFSSFIFHLSLSTYRRCEGRSVSF